ncbi:elongation factor G [Candidatus Palauibacter sp.]|uniref:elongation factor G n=1 Tax=Candidatus Palauibacter sp. TaxID=3101350 RepID=UPI003B025505
MASAASAYETPNIRNVVLFGHGGAGKTTLVDAMCYVAGNTNRKGDVQKGNALTDFTPEETGHGISINLAVAHAVWNGARVNLIDTPGYLDFLGEVLAGIRVADAGLCLVDAISGVEVGTEKTWSAAEAARLPRAVFVSMMDRDNANFRRTVDEIREELSPNAMPVHAPIGSGGDFRGIVDLLSMKAYMFKGGDRGAADEVDAPDDVVAEVDDLREALIEAIVAADDDLLEAYFEGEELDPGRVGEVLSDAIRSGDVVPVFCGSCQTSAGVPALLDRIVELLPSPDRSAPQTARNGSGEVELEPGAAGPTTALVFKTTSEPHVGDLSYFRVFSGRITNGVTLVNPGRSSTERLAHLAIPHGSRRVDVEALNPGDIGVVTKLKDTHTGDTLCDGGAPLTLDGIRWPTPDLSLAVTARTRADEDKIGSGLAKLHEEDPTFSSGYDPERGQTIIRGLGEIHLNISLEKMTRKYGVNVDTHQPNIAYRETITRTAEGQGRHKKQSGGRGQFGDCYIRLSPQARGSGYEFVDSIKGGVIPTKFVPAVGKGVEQASRKGVIAGYPLVDFRAECYDGSHHSVDSSDIAFQIAGSIAFQKVAREANPVILEPIMVVEVETPEQYMGEVMGDLNQRRGRVLGMESRGRRQIVKAHVPQAELYKYSAALRSLTHGKATHTRSLAAYEQVPPHVQERVIAESQRDDDE